MSTPKSPAIVKASPKVAAQYPSTLGDATADMILKSCDNERFYVAKAIMAVASPMFKDMLAAARPEADRMEDKGKRDEEALVVNMSEDSWTLNALLRICYPLAKPPLSELGPLRRTLQLLEASRKYAIAPVRDTCAEYLYKYVLPLDPMSVYVVAYKYGMENLAKAAAEGTMNCSQEEVLNCNMPETDTTSYRTVRRIFAFRKEC